jgi:hypothetical protein
MHRKSAGRSHWSPVETTEEVRVFFHRNSGYKRLRCAGNPLLHTTAWTQHQYQRGRIPHLKFQFTACPKPHVNLTCSLPADARMHQAPDFCAEDDSTPTAPAGMAAIIECGRPATLARTGHRAISLYRRLKVYYQRDGYSGRQQHQQRSCNSESYLDHERFGAPAV